VTRQYEIRDPIHNFILFDDFERKLIDSEPFQRLRHIKQLALTQEVYPGAAHSRFEHSLGTMQLATQAFDIIAPDAKVLLRWSEHDLLNYRQLLRVGALLHDIGHAPFSHGPEELLPEGFEGHEAFTAALIQSDYLRPLLNMGSVSLNPEHVVGVALGAEKSPQQDPTLQLLQELVAGDLGVDRMDYLVRDALHTGVAAGRFDYHRLLNTLKVIENPETGSPVLAIGAGGLHAAEQLLLARYFMFTQVYFHKTRRIYDIHLVDFLAESLPGGRFPAELSDYLRYNDDVVGVSIQMALSGGGRLQELAERVVNRNHFRLAYEMVGQDRASDPDIFSELREFVVTQFGDGVRSDEMKKKAVTLEPGDLYIAGGNQQFEDIMQRSELIRLLKPIWAGRIYAQKDIREDVRKACEQFKQQRGEAR
jgi:HD superfamily phosphohydrolase